MLELFGFPLGTVFQGGTFAALLILIASIFTVFIRGMPDRTRAGNERRQIDVDEAEKIRTDYAQQIKDFRVEVHGYRGDLMKVQAELTKSKSISMRRGDRLNMVMFILRLVMGELRRLDPDSTILTQAEALLAQAIADGEGELTPAEAAARETVKAAKRTVEQIAGKNEL